jgi:hypothetical protein
MAKERTARSVRAYARGARLALWLQVFVAAGALGASVWLGGRIAGQASRLAEQGRDLEARQVELQKQLQALERVQSALRLMNEPIPKNDLAIGQLLEARDLIGPEPSLVRTLAEAQFANDDPSGALQTLSALFEPPEETGGPEPIERTLDDLVRLAKYHCGAGDTGSAQALIEGALSGANRDTFLGDDGFTAACAEIAASLFEETPDHTGRTEFDPASEYKVWSVFFHIRVEADRTAAVALAQGLCAAGYAVPGIELVPEPASYPRWNDVRFYHEQQKAEAQHVAGLVSSLARAANAEAWSSEPRVRPLSGYQDLPEDRIELWLTDSGALTDATHTTGSKRFSCSSDAATRVLVARLNAEERSARLQAGQEVANRVRNETDDLIVEALLAELDSPRLDALTVTGRLNVLFMLNLRPSWAGERASRLAERLEAIEAHELAIGAQTQDCVAKLRAKIAGQSAANSCGRP